MSDCVLLQVTEKYNGRLKMRAVRTRRTVVRADKSDDELLKGSQLQQVLTECRMLWALGKAKRHADIRRRAFTKKDGVFAPRKDKFTTEQVCKVFSGVC